MPRWLDPSPSAEGGERMIENLLPQRELAPAYYLAHEQSRAIIETLADASLEAKTALADVMNQFFVDTATWGLALWEWQVGLQTDTSLSLDTRRAAIRQKLVASGNTARSCGIHHRLRGQDHRQQRLQFLSGISGRKERACRYRCRGSSLRCGADQARAPSFCDLRNHLG